MDCTLVRDRLTEHSLSALEPGESADVERHLAWCAGCRKEADELASGAAVAGLSVAQADPPADLEDRVVEQVRGASAPRTSRRRFRGLVVALVAAAVLGGGWATTFARLQSEQQARVASQEQAEQVAKRFQTLSHELLNRRPPGPLDSIRQAQLSPQDDALGGGSAMLYSSPRLEDWVLVVLGGLSPKGAPYSVALRDRYGAIRPVGTIANLDAGGGAVRWHEYRGSLRGYDYVVVTDRSGHTVLAGTISPSATITPNPSA